MSLKSFKLPSLSAKAAAPEAAAMPESGPPLPVVETTPAVPAGKRSKLAIVSPLPPRRSGIGAYTAELLPYLAQVYDLTVVVEHDFEADEARGWARGWNVIAANDTGAETTLGEGAIIYQLGNNPDHEFVYRLAMRIPGVVVLHDYVLHHLIEGMTLARGQDEPYFRVLEREYGPSGLVLGRLRRSGFFSEQQKFLMPLSRHVSRRAKGMIVHSEYVARRLGWPVDPRVLITHHHFSPTADQLLAGKTKTQSRKALSLPKDKFIFLSLGFVTRPKKPDLALAALKLLKDRGFEFIYMLVGQCSEREWIDEHIKQHGLQKDVRFSEYVEEDAFFEYINAGDALISLRYPTAGESSGTLTRAMGLGMPSVIFDYGPMSEMPDDTVEKVKFVRDEKLLVRRLADAFERLIVDPAYREKVGAAGRAYVRENCSVQGTLDTYAAATAAALDEGDDLPDLDEDDMNRPQAR
ncbi:MAG: glycosyltransferase family 4 protein [Caulobacteraceae bacterium]